MRGHRSRGECRDLCGGRWQAASSSETWPWAEPEAFLATMMDVGWWRQGWQNVWICNGTNMRGNKHKRLLVWTLQTKLFVLPSETPDNVSKNKQASLVQALKSPKHHQHQQSASHAYTGEQKYTTFYSAAHRNKFLLKEAELPAHFPNWS